MDYQLVAINSKLGILNRLMITKMMYDGGLMSKEKYKKSLVTLWVQVYNVYPKDFDAFYDNFEKIQ